MIAISFNLFLTNLNYMCVQRLQVHWHIIWLWVSFVTPKELICQLQPSTELSLPAVFTHFVWKEMMPFGSHQSDHELVKIINSWIALTLYFTFSVLCILSFQTPAILYLIIYSLIRIQFSQCYLYHALNLCLFYISELLWHHSVLLLLLYHSITLFIAVRFRNCYQLILPVLSTKSSYNNNKSSSKYPSLIFFSSCC